MTTSGPYAIAYHIKHGIVNPIRRWAANEPYVYLDADHNVRTSSIHRDYSHEMAPMLGEVALMLAPGANALARGERFPMNARRTVTVLETAEGRTLVSGGASDLSAAQIEVARRLGLTPTSPMPGIHAEKTAIAGAGELGLTPTRGATSNIICMGPNGCRSFIKELGGRVTGDFTYEF